MSIPFAKTKWDEIIPNLFQGGHDYDSGRAFDPRQELDSIDPVIVRDEFDLIVSLYSRWGYGPDKGIKDMHLRIPDGHLTGEEFAKVCDLVPHIALAVAQGKRVLVRCQAGYNRSGLVVALVLLAHGYTADAAIALIREKRSGFALCNESFVELIHGQAAALAEVA